MATTTGGSTPNSGHVVDDHRPLSRRNADATSGLCVSVEPAVTPAMAVAPVVMAAPPPGAGAAGNRVQLEAHDIYTGIQGAEATSSSVLDSTKMDASFGNSPLASGVGGSGHERTSSGSRGYQRTQRDQQHQQKQQCQQQ